MTMKRTSFLTVLFTMIVVAAAFLASARTARADTTHIVQPGDTLYEIAQQYGVSVEAIAEANNLSNIRAVMLGYPLIIPGVDGPLGAPTPTPRPRATPRPYVIPESAVAVPGGVMHTVEAGDTLFRISMIYNVLMANIAEANNLADGRTVQLGQKLFIPGARLANPAPAATPRPSTGTSAPAAPVATTGGNLFKNGDFEGDWYFYLYNELQVPVGWQIVTDEGPNTLEPGSGGNFNRPEMRVVGRHQLPPEEHPLFIFNGDKTVKTFKGGAPTSFSLFQDVYLQPGRYRMTLNFFPDIVAQYYPGGARDFVTDPLAGEARIIHNNGGTNFTPVEIGAKNSRVYDFTVSQPGAVRLGGSLRSRFETANNGWFLDDWRLERIGD